MKPNKGKIWVHKQIQEWSMYKDSESVHLWVHLMIEADHVPYELYDTTEKREFVIPKGVVVTSRKDLAKATGINPHKIQRILKVFENAQQIAQLMRNKYRYVALLNHTYYNETAHQNAQQVHNNCTSTKLSIIRLLKTINMQTVNLPEKLANAELIEYFLDRLATVNPILVTELRNNLENQDEGVNRLKRKLKKLGKPDTEEYLKKIFKWIFEDYYPDAQKWQGWGSVVKSIPPLCTGKKGEPAKIARIIEQMERKQKAAASKTGSTYKEL